MDPLAQRIAETHEQAERNADAARAAIAETIAARRQAAAMVEAAKAQHGARLRSWWEANLPHAMDYGTGRRYLQIARVADRPAVGDKRQLMLCGLLPATAGRRITGDGPQWPWIRKCAVMAGTLADPATTRDLPPVARLAAISALRRLQTGLETALEALGWGADEPPGDS